MAFLHKIKRLVQDPPPEYVFELSEAGIAWFSFRSHDRMGVGFEPLEEDIISVSPLRDNVLRPEALTAKVRQIVGGVSARKRAKAVLILPDFCARIAVLEFDNFPADPAQQISLVRFRMKKSVPFDVESAAISYYAQSSKRLGKAPGGKSVDVTVVVASLEIVARYEAAFRAAGLHPGIVTTSALASVDLDKSEGVSVIAKLCGRVLTVSVLLSGVLKLVRCVELPDVSREEIMGVLYPTVAYIEDELAVRPARVLMCGFGVHGEQYREDWEREFGVTVQQLRSKLGDPQAFNAGLLGYLESPEVAA